MTNEGQRRLVLTEEDYTSKLSSIVARDFFPDVSKLERQNALLDRRLEGDVAGAIAVRRATRRWNEREEEAALKRDQDDRDVVVEPSKRQIMSVRSKTAVASGRPIRKRPRPLEDETVTGFLKRATNEDDHEFDSNLERDIQENRQRLGDFHESNRKSSSYPNNENSLRLLEMASDDFAPESNRIQWNKPPMRNGLFFNPTPTTAQSQTNDNTILKLLKGSVEASASTEDRRLMPPPTQQTSGILSISTVETKDNAHLSKSELVEYIPKHNLEKKIQPSATRFPSAESLVSTVGSSGKGILAKELESDSETDYMSSTTEGSTDLDAPQRPVEEERRRYQSKQKSDRRAFVAMTPQIIPGAGNESPITTWGSIDGTPIVLSGRNDEAPEPSPSLSFRMSERSERESAASKAELLLAQRAKLASKSSGSKSKTRRRQGVEGKLQRSLTPAALSLLEKTKSSLPPTGGAFVSALRTSYTPKLRASSSSSSSSSLKYSRRASKTRRRDHAYNATPQT